ncbi:MAG: hypothetical protein C7B46_10080 [Sulfobacillus benefaciens]|uniref:Glycosyltransferase 2-like domain-containing protein n=1 Tax=Sulfobacillus benefaciens TaxID=453960 RepID=A0A2T2XFW4_9FIRM|nr:MAG: hypothetical protein C7B46_10080 [Sulfobacillus benefaciens]
MGNCLDFPYIGENVERRDTMASISIVMPVYNVAPFVAEAIHSCLNQSLPFDELIVVDDGSNDGTREIVQEFAAMDYRIQMICTPHNIGPSGSRQFGASQSRCDYIAFLDGDDWWAPSRLSELLKIGQSFDADIICDNAWLVLGTQKVPWTNMFKDSRYPLSFPKLISYRDFYGFNFGRLHPIVRREFMTMHNIGFSSHIRYLEHFVFLLHALDYNARVLVSPTPYYYYRSRPGSMVMSGDTAIQLQREALDWARQCSLSPSAQELLDLMDKQIADGVFWYRCRQEFATHRYGHLLWLALSHPHHWAQLVDEIPRSLFRHWLKSRLSVTEHP